MKIKISKPTVALTAGDLEVDVDSFNIVTEAGTLHFYERADGKLAVLGTAAFRAAGDDEMVIEVSQ